MKLWMIFVAFLVTVQILPVPISAEEKLEKFAGTKRCMGVKFRIVLYAKDIEVARANMKAAFERIDELNSILSDYDPKSELSRLSRSGGSGKVVEVSADLWTVLKASERVWKLSQKRFDPTIGPLSEIWKEAIRSEEFPKAEEIEIARKRCGFDKIEFVGEKKVRLLAKQMKLDLGGIAKGYAADEALKVLKELGTNSALVDGSGDIALGDPPPNRNGWNIEFETIKNQSEQSNAVRLLVLSNCGVATSGAKYQFIEHNGKTYSHIVDPTTGFAVTQRIRSTVIAKNGMMADALASSINVLGVEKSLKLVESLDQTEAALQSFEGELKVSKKFNWETRNNNNAK